MKNSYGNTWWGKQWLNALGNIDYSNRLPRGRTYANKGLAKDILIKGNKITASVQGSRPRPYKVNFTIPKFTANEKAGIIEIVTSNPLHLSRLLNRELPTELKKICDQKGIPLFPNSWKDIEGACSCPDWAVPCKHMASVLYLIANEIDKNPFLIFQLHDFDLFQGLEGIGYTAQGQREVAVLAAEKLQQPYLSNRITNDWDEEVYQQLDFSMIPDCRENLLTILSEKPVFFPIGDFKAMLKLAYSAVSKNLTKTIAAEIQGTDTAVMDQVEEVDILLDEERGFLNATFRNSRGKTILSFDKQPELIEWLGQIPLSSFPNFSGSLKGLSLAFQFARKLAQQSACIPQLLRMGLKHYKIRWLPALLNPVVRSMSDGVKAILPTDILFYKKGKDIEEPIEEDKMPALISFFLDYLIHQHHQLNYRFREHEIGHLFFNGAILNFQTYETKEYPTTIQLWLNKFFIVEKDFVPVIKIDEDEAFGFRVNISIQKKTKTPTAPIKLSAILQQKKYLDLRMEVLRDLAMLSDYFPQINHLVASGGKEDLHFDSEEFVEVLFKILPTIRLFGIKVLLPKALRKLLRPQLSLLLEADADSGVIRKKSIINLDNMLSFNWQIALGDQVISEEEFLKMIKQFSGIIKINDRYVFFDENEIMALIEQLKNPPNLDPNQLLHIALTEDYKGAKVSLDKKTQQLIQRLLAGEDVAIPQGLKATLRPYQRTGYEWLYKNSRIGFGSLIADDMGLGKTLQVITTLLKLKEDGELGIQKALIIVPTTLLTNWVKEINKFAPTLKTFVYHGSNRTLQPLKEADILLTTYGVARSEVETFQKNKWLLLAIDEAQNIKNPTTAQTKAIKKIKAPIKIAMSGTPVENRLSEYWSIFDFTNRGYLSSLAKFKENFARPIEADRDQVKLNKFRKITEPFILRRLKSDKSIIKDLPDKIEKDQFCQLTPEQTAIYQKVIDSTMKTIDKAEGIARKGLILKLLTALKQICNHPKQFLKKGNPDPGLSGKCILLFDLIGQIQQSGEKTLIFTQYQEMGKLLVEMLEHEFKLEIPFLHGGVSRKGRDEMVEDFQHNRATRILILSLKAGGTGLNLTAASNVIHYDLWWNPAVEAQATDRAYRIGQMNNVMVHRFITQNTFEEKINQLLQQKKELANLTVSTGEKWIGDLSNAELKKLVKLE
jgi:SNF2 family DNA or RNA helicase/uncharacterized Zn finger protein